jgi:hypothetical protein
MAAIWPENSKAPRGKTILRQRASMGASSVSKTRRMKPDRGAAPTTPANMKAPPVSQSRARRRFFNARYDVIGNAGSINYAWRL